MSARINSPGDAQGAASSYPYIEQYTAASGERLARIAGRRITVANVAIWYEQEGESVEDIARDYDLTPSQVHAALVYFYDHRAEVDRQIAEEMARYNAGLKSHPSLLDQTNEQNT
jgi:uncharacterized protein (DUF433 family)